MKEEVYDDSMNVRVLNVESKQKWISMKDYLPFDGSGSKGDYCGSYLCVVERKLTKEDFKNTLGGRRNGESQIYKSIEFCYWNMGCKSFQDSKRNWVKVTHWSPVPAMPIHNVNEISREEMLLRIGFCELVEIFNKNKNVKFFDIDDAYALSGIPYDMSAYRSTIDIDDTTNVMYCALAEEYKTLI